MYSPNFAFSTFNRVTRVSRYRDICICRSKNYRSLLRTAICHIKSTYPALIYTCLYITGLLNIVSDNVDEECG